MITKDLLVVFGPLEIKPAVEAQVIEDLLGRGLLIDGILVAQAEALVDFVQVGEHDALVLGRVLRRGADRAVRDMGNAVLKGPDHAPPVHRNFAQPTVREHHGAIAPQVVEVVLIEHVAEDSIMGNEVEREAPGDPEVAVESGDLGLDIIELREALAGHRQQHHLLVFPGQA